MILAAGVGSRMKSRYPKVMQKVAGKPMLRWLIDTLEPLGPKKIVVVVGPDMPEVEALASPHTCVHQTERLGTGHAAQQALPELEGFDGDVFLMVGDMPLVTGETLLAIRDLKNNHPRPSLVAVGMRPEDPLRYGRIIVDKHNRLEKIVEYKDASESERSVKLCNAGLYCVDNAGLKEWLPRLGNQNASGEYYLTDIVDIARRDDKPCACYEAHPDEVQAANSRAELATLETIAQKRLRTDLLANGVQMIAPETVFLSHDTKIGADTVLEPYQIFGEGVTVGAGVSVKGFCHLEDCTIGDEAEIGPYARIRGGSEIGLRARVGNFVEVKASRFAERATVKHLSYIGDGELGEYSNIGAGTVTCNYDGYSKHKTQVADNVSVGGNCTLVAPVTVGMGAYVAAGSVITDDIPKDALAFGRARQEVKRERAVKLRERLSGMQKRVAS